MIKHFITFLILFVAGSGVSYANSLTDPFRPDDLGDAVVSYWPLSEEASATSWRDVVGTNHLTPRGLSISTSESDKWSTNESSVSLNGVEEEFLEIEDESQTDLDQTGSFAFGGWFKPSGTRSVAFLSKGNTGGHGYSITLSDNNLSCNFGDRILTSGVNNIRGKWNHVVCQYDTTSNVLQLYVNGQLSRLLTDVDALADSTESFFVGAIRESGLGDVDHFDGLAKDVFVTNRLLTDAEILSLGFGIDTEMYFTHPNDLDVQPTAYWPLNEVGIGAEGTDTYADAIGDIDLTGQATSFRTTVGGWLHSRAVQVRSATLSAAYTSSTDLDITGSYSISGWFSSTQANERLHRLYHRVSGTHGVSLELNTQAYPVLSHGSSIVCTGSRVVEAYPVRWVNLPYLITATYDATSQEANIYVNGVNVCTESSVEAPTAIPSGTSGSMFVASATSTRTASFSDIAVWNGHVLTEDEREELLLGRNVQQSGLVSYWNLDGNTSTAEDSVGDNDLVTADTIASVPGRINTARELGPREIFSIADASQEGLDFLDSFTILYWTRIGVLSNLFVWDDLVGKGSGTDGWRLRYRGDTGTRILSGSATVATSFGAATNGTDWTFVGYSHEQDDSIADSTLIVVNEGNSILSRQTPVAGNTRIPSLSNGEPFMLGSAVNQRVTRYDDMQVFSRSLHDLETYGLFLRTLSGEPGVPEDTGDPTPPVTTTRSRVIYIY